MGRGSGGASHGGGGHTGGHSFGGRSSGGSSHSRGGSFGGPIPPPRGPRYSGYYPRPPRRYYGGYRRSRGGCLSTVVALLIVLLVVFSVFYSNIKSSQNSQVSPSATKRTAITGTTTYKEWYADQLHYIEHDSDLTDGMKYFYSKTGIQPYVLFMDYNSDFWNNGSWDEAAADAYLAEFYKNTFSDNGHMILAYFACENDSKDLDGTFYLYYGSSAYSIMDKEAETIFWSYFDANYDNLDYSIAEFMGKTFTQTADNIMHIEKSSTAKEILIISFAGVIVILLVLAVIFTKVLKKVED